MKTPYGIDYIEALKKIGVGTERSLSGRKAPVPTPPQEQPSQETPKEEDKQEDYNI